MFFLVLVVIDIARAKWRRTPAFNLTLPYLTPIFFYKHQQTFEEALEDEPNDENVRFAVINFSDISPLDFNLLSFVGGR